MSENWNIIIISVFIFIFSLIIKLMQFQLLVPVQATLHRSKRYSKREKQQVIHFWHIGFLLKRWFDDHESRFSSCKDILKCLSFYLYLPDVQKSRLTLRSWPPGKHVKWTFLKTNIFLQSFGPLSHITLPQSDTCLRLSNHSLFFSQPCVALIHCISRVNLDCFLLIKWSNDGNVFLNLCVSARFTLNT